MTAPLLNSDQFDRLFPFHLIINDNLRMVQCGKSLRKVYPDILNAPFPDVFELVRPQVSIIDIAHLRNIKDLVILKTRKEKSMMLRGQFEKIESTDLVLFMGTPWFNSMDQVKSFNLGLKDFAISDPMMDLLHVLKTEEIVSEEIRELLEKVNRQKMDSERMAQRMNSLFEHATEGILLSNTAGIVLLANPAAERLFAYEKGEMAGLTIENLIPFRYRSQHETHRGSFLQYPSNRHMGKGRDLYALKKTGGEFPVEISLSHFKNGEESFVIAFVIDISQRKEIEGNLNKQKEQLEKITFEVRKLNAELEAKVEERTIILKEALQRLEESQEELSAALDKERQLNEIKSRFVAMASHEFRTPLSTMLSSANLLKKYTAAEDQPKRIRHIDKITASIHHLNVLLEDFLSLGKLDEGKLNPKLQSIDLEEIVKDTVGEVEGQLKDGQSFIFEDCHSVKINSDKNLIKNILFNLLSNAIKFSEEGKNIHISCREEKDTISVTVRDNGIGISLEDQEHLFSSFFRGKNALNIQGTGLGLHIVKRYLELLGGYYSIQSDLGKGTSITFTLPTNRDI